jgi:hypothetical protein
MATNFYPYDYFCGANVFITVDGQPLLEAAGISYTEQDSMQPIYGYSSRLFDAVAPGQKIIQGTLVVNQVDPDYLFESILMGRDTSGSPLEELTRSALVDDEGVVITPGDQRPPTYARNIGDLWRTGGTGGIAQNGYEAADSGVLDIDKNIQFLTSELQSHYWDRAGLLNMTQAEAEAAARGGQQYRNTDLTLIGPTNIKIEFANQFNVELHSAFFVSRSSGIQIDENVILEEYSFFARALSVGD